MLENLEYFLLAFLLDYNVYCKSVVLKLECTS